LCGGTCAGDLGLDEKRLEGIVLSRVSSSVANVGLARVEEIARQLVAGNWDQLAGRNWGKSGGHRTPSGVIICCKRWSRSCRGKCPIAHCSLVTGGKPEGIVLLRMRSSVVNSGFVRAEKGAQQLLEGNWGKAKGHRTLANAIIRCKQWFLSCRGRCPTSL
jgi:hypothetical protein